jgi:hypothetical protein
MEANWIPRRNRPNNRNTVYIHSLHTTVDIDEYEVTCGGCNKLLDEHFITMPCYHSTCVKCLHLEGDSTHTCPKCKTRAPITDHKDPVIDEVMKNYPRTVPCGITCNGWIGAKEHELLCIVCSKLVNKDLEFENASLKLGIINQGKYIKTLENSNEVLQKELQKYILKYGPIIDEEKEMEEEESPPIL